MGFLGRRRAGASRTRGPVRGWQASALALFAIAAPGPAAADVREASEAIADRAAQRMIEAA